MKRIKLLLAIFAVAGMSAVGYTTDDNMPMSNLDKLMLSNIEALATEEIRVECSLLLYNVHSKRLNGALVDWYCTKDGGVACKRPNN